MKYIVRFHIRVIMMILQMLRAAAKRDLILCRCNVSQYTTVELFSYVFLAVMGMYRYIEHVSLSHRIAKFVI